MAKVVKRAIVTSGRGWAASFLADVRQCWMLTTQCGLASRCDTPTWLRDKYFRRVNSRNGSSPLGHAQAPTGPYIRSLIAAEPYHRWTPHGAISPDDLGRSRFARTLHDCYSQGRSQSWRRPYRWISAADLTFGPRAFRGLPPTGSPNHGVPDHAFACPHATRPSRAIRAT